MVQPAATEAPAAGPGQGIDRVLAWSDREWPRMAALLALRRQWMTDQFLALRRDYDRATAGGPAPADQDGARAVLEALPGVRRFQWTHRYIQDRTWLECNRLVEARLPEIEALLAPRPGDLGTLDEVPGIDYPDYYQETEFHRQGGGIWRDPRGAALYLLGARIVHVGRNSDFQIHDAFAAAIGDPVPAPARILDLGCGFGKTTFSLKARWPEAAVHGIDLAAPCLRLGRRMATERGLAIDWRQAGIEQLPDPDASADLAVVTMVLHELPEPAIDAVLAEAHRVLRPGGWLVTLENRLIGDPFRDQILAWYSQLIDEPFWEPFRHLDLPAKARAAGFAEATQEPWYAPGQTPEQEADPDRFFTPWGLMRARKA